MVPGCLSLNRCRIYRPTQCTCTMCQCTLVDYVCIHTNKNLIDTINIYDRGHRGGFHSFYLRAS